MSAYAAAVAVAVARCVDRNGPHACSAACPGVGVVFVPMAGGPVRSGGPTRTTGVRGRRSRPMPRPLLDTARLHGGAVVARAVAYHEAGHAAAAVAVAVPLFRVSIVPDRNARGVERAGHCVHDTAAPADDALLIAVAGAVAESIGTGRHVDVGGSDATSAWEAARTPAAIRAGRARADRLLREPARWAGVEDLVAELLRYGQVTGRQAFELIRQHTRGAA